MKTCPKQENFGLTHPFRVNCTSSCKMEKYFRELHLYQQLQIPRFIIPPYHVISQYNGRTIYYHPQSQIGCPISSLIHKLGCPKRPIFPDIPIWGVPNDPNCPFSNQCRPCVLSLTAAFKPKFPTSKDPFYTGEYFLKITLITRYMNIPHLAPRCLFNQDFPTLMYHSTKFSK